MVYCRTNLEPFTIAREFDGLSLSCKTGSGSELESERRNGFDVRNVFRGTFGPRIQLEAQGLRGCGSVDKVAYRDLRVWGEKKTPNVDAPLGQILAHLIVVHLQNVNWTLEFYGHVC
jgi:hypothetical protein